MAGVEGLVKAGLLACFARECDSFRPARFPVAFSSPVALLEDEMKISEAKAECERWLAYIERQKFRSSELAKIAAARRRSEMTLAEATKAMRALEERSPTVYDGGNLELAVRALLKATPAPTAGG